MSVKKVSLKDWINKLGVNAVSKQLKVCQATVRHWRRGHALPAYAQMRDIKRLSNGSVSYDTMIDGFKGKLPSRRKKSVPAKKSVKKTPKPTK